MLLYDLVCGDVHFSYFLCALKGDFSERGISSLGDISDHVWFTDSPKDRHQQRCGEHFKIIKQTMESSVQGYIKRHAVCVSRKFVSKKVCVILSFKCFTESHTSILAIMKEIMIVSFYC